MRILYLGSISPTACASFYADAAESIGHTVFRWDPQFFHSKKLKEYLELKIFKRPTQQKLDWNHQEILKKCIELKIDLVLNLAENFVPLSLLQELKALPKPPKLIYHSHDNNFSSGILKSNDFFETLSWYDCVFTTKSQNLQKYKMLGQSRAFYIPSAYEPKIHRPISASESRLGGKEFAVSFVGTYDKSRDRFLKELDWEKLYVWGDRWTRFKQYSKYRDHIFPKAIYFPDFADVLSHSQVTLGLLREEAEDRHTQRTFEIPACGAFQIAPRNDEILSYFTEDQEIVCFESPQEMKEKVDYYLNHPTERKRIAEAGFKRVTQGNHSYRHRVITMLEKSSTA